MAAVRRTTPLLVSLVSQVYPWVCTLTNSAAGVRSVEGMAATLEVMQEHGVPLLVHGEVTEPEIDIFDRVKKSLSTVI